MPFSRPGHDRRIEWWFGLQTTGFGFWLSHPSPSMDSKAFGFLRAMASEPGWAGIFMLIGFGHCLALAINGRAWWTPFIRLLTVALNTGGYALFAFGFYRIDPWTTGVFTYAAGLCSAGAICFVGAARDADHSWEVRRNAHSS